MKIKLRKTDRLFTQIMRILYGYTCQKCGKRYNKNDSLYNLGVSHYYGRSRESTRFDQNNCTLLCNLPCHRYWETEGRSKYTEYMIKRLGEEGMELLSIRANTYCKRDDKGMEILLKKRLEELKGGEKWEN